MSGDGFGRNFFGTPSPSEPSPGPWRLKSAETFNMRKERQRVWVVLDANDTCVAECERAVDADFIMRHGPAGPSEEQLAAELRTRVGLSSMDSMPASYTVTLVDRDRTFQACDLGDDDQDEDRRIISALADKVVAQALAARKAGG